MWPGRVRRIGGDLGYCRTFSRPVLDVLGPRLANTAALMVAAFVLALSIGLPAGMLAATRPGSVLDGAINLAASPRSRCRPSGWRCC